MSIGLAAIFSYKNEQNKANLWSIHSWLGVGTIALYLAQYILGAYLFFYESADIDMREAYIPFFAFLDIFVYVSASFTAESGIVELNTSLGCAYNQTSISDFRAGDPALYYSDLPTGCRVSSGLGIVILVLCMCTVYAALELRLPELSNTAAGWEAYKLTEDEARRRGNLWEWFLGALPIQSSKKNNKKSNRGKPSKKKGSNWVEKSDGNGIYYFNTKTKESTKTKPNDF